jgi:nicotinamidase-related amidase
MADQLEARRTALLIYDMTQTLMDEGPYIEPWVVEGLPGHARLLEACRKAGVLITYGISAKGYAGFDVCKPIAPQGDETVVRHGESGAFTDTPLLQALRDNQRDTLLITGMAVDRGCNLTAREALNRGLTPIVVRDACYTRDIKESPVGPVPKAEVARVHLAALYRLGVGIMSSDEVIRALG